MTADLESRIVASPTALLTEGGPWDALLARSRSDTVFLTSGWLRAAWETYAQEADVLASLVFRGEATVAGGIFVCSNGTAELLGSPPSDYLDLVTDDALSESERATCIRMLFESLLEARRDLTTVHLYRLPADTGTAAIVQQLDGLWATRLRTMPAPTMDMEAAPKALRKKSLRRHANRLAKQGEVSVVHLTDAASIQERLEPFFEQHVSRWSGTPHPSLFRDEQHRRFYRRFVDLLGPTGRLRYCEILLDGRLVAAHLGASYAGRYTWYKPTYDPALARFSPGEVLLKALIEHAQQEDVAEFDFTIGDEPFKQRFATRTREVVDLHVTPRRFRALALRARLGARQLVKAPLERLGIWDRIRR